MSPRTRTLKYVPVLWRDQLWPRFTKSIIKEIDTDPLPVREKFVEHELDIVRKLHAAGVPLLAGTDTPAGIDVIPGFSLHLELIRLVRPGSLRCKRCKPRRSIPRVFWTRRRILAR